MATKVDNPTSTNGLGLPMSKEPFRPLACCRVKSAYEYYRETRCTKPWQLSHTTCGLLSCMGLALLPRKECPAVSLSWPNLAGCRWLRLYLGHKNGSPNGCIPISFQWLVCDCMPKCLLFLSPKLNSHCCVDCGTGRNNLNLHVHRCSRQLPSRLVFRYPSERWLSGKSPSTSRP